MSQIDYKLSCKTYLFNHLCLNDIPKDEQLRLQFMEIFRRLTLIEEKLKMNYDMPIIEQDIDGEKVE